MKNKKYYILFILVMIIAVGTMLAVNNSVTKEELLIKEFYSEAKNIELFKDISDDSFISLNFPGVMRAYKIDGKVKALISSCVGYNGPVDVLTAVGNNDEIVGIKIIQHEETLDYAEHLESDWFLERFKNIVLDRFLNLVILDQENPEDIIQITGATISSKAVVTAVNASIGAYNYVNNGIKMSSVADVIPQEMWQKELNSFAINYADQTIRIDMDELKGYPQVERDVILINTTGTESKMKVNGPTLRNLLEEEGIDLSEFQAIGVTGRDGYYTMIDKEKLDVSEVILSWEVNGKPIDEAEKPVRIAMPDELGPYWVKMVSTIDLYDEISPKDIEKVHFFEPLTKDIEPYYYEYYGSKDKSIEIGKILAKFDNVDTKGFFTMVSVDGLEKNETISLVRQRYFLKIEGENAPMNIAPNFKLGMNVKQMTHFSTTKDAVVFPEKMKAVVTTKSIGVDEGLLLEDVLKKVSMKWSSQTNFLAISEDGIILELSQEDIQNTYLLMSDDVVMLYLGDDLVMKNLLRIEKYES
jgi:Na+-translocating ferredoxin:NAD+ oxidoreductase RnfG subunit/DMSO/TMAO reductase YedYZ molybdopterin-dependent catalytic subunit